MGVYSYKLLRDPSLPLAPKISFHLTPARLPFSEASLTQRKIYCSDAFLDTGADYTFVPLSWATQLAKKSTGKARPLTTIAGGRTLAVPYLVGIIFDNIYIPDFEIWACPDQALSGEVLIGRDLLNLLKVEFDGPQLQFTITASE